mgnify:CR=1 FL=1
MKARKKKRNPGSRLSSSLHAGLSSTRQRHDDKEKQREWTTAMMDVDHADEPSSSASSRMIQVEGEDHTLGTLLVSSLWVQPHVEIAQYSQKHVVNREEIAVHVQTDGEVSATTSLVEAAKLVKRMLAGMDDSMRSALEKWDQLPEEEKEARNRRGKGKLESEFADAEAKVRAGESQCAAMHVDDDGEGEDDPFLRIVREVRRRRGRNADDDA